MQEHIFFTFDGAKVTKPLCLAENTYLYSCQTGDIHVASAYHIEM